MTSWIPQPGALGSRGIKIVGSRIYTESQYLQKTLPLREQQKQQSDNENSQTEDTVTSNRAKKGKAPTAKISQRHPDATRGWGPRPNG